MATKKTKTGLNQSCTQSDLKSVRDALQVLSGTWKLPILMALASGPKRFKELSKEITGISDKMLSKELKDLEMNHLVKRTVYDSFPPTVEYEATSHTPTLRHVIAGLRDWGVVHRKKVLGK